MRKATDTTLRNLAMLQAIPAHPRTKNTREIMDELRRMDPEFAVDVRTIQRSLERLSAKFPITCEAQGRANHWYWIDRHAVRQCAGACHLHAVAVDGKADVVLSGPVAVCVGIDEEFANHRRGVVPEPLARHAFKALAGDVRLQVGKRPVRERLLDEQPRPLLAEADERDVQDLVEQGIVARVPTPEREQTQARLGESTTRLEREQCIGGIGAATRAIAVRRHEQVAMLEPDRPVVHGLFTLGFDEVLLEATLIQLAHRAAVDG